VANAAKKLLALDSKNFSALYYLATVSPTLGDSPQVLADAEMAARGMLANLDTVFAAYKKPATTSDADWKKARHDMEVTANTTLDWLYNKKKEIEAAEREHKSMPPSAPSIQLKEGQTPEEVEKLLGKPKDTITLQENLIYIYSTVKVIFKSGKLVDVQ